MAKTSYIYVILVSAIVLIPLFSSYRSSRSQDVLCLCVIFLKRTLKMSSSSILKSLESRVLASKQASKQASMQAIKQASKQASMQVINQASKQGGKQAGKQVRKQAGKQVGKKASR